MLGAGDNHFWDAFRAVCLDYRDIGKILFPNIKNSGVANKPFAFFGKAVTVEGSSQLRGSVTQEHNLRRT